MFKSVRCFILCLLLDIALLGFAAHIVGILADYAPVPLIAVMIILVVALMALSICLYNWLTEVFAQNVESEDAPEE